MAAIPRLLVGHEVAEIPIVLLLTAEEAGAEPGIKCPIRMVRQPMRRKPITTQVLDHSEGLPGERAIEGVSTVAVTIGHR